MCVIIYFNLQSTFLNIWVIYVDTLIQANDTNVKCVIHAFQHW